MIFFKLKAKNQENPLIMKIKVQTRKSRKSFNQENQGSDKKSRKSFNQENPGSDKKILRQTFLK